MVSDGTIIQLKSVSRPQVIHAEWFNGECWFTLAVQEQAHPFNWFHTSVQLAMKPSLPKYLAKS
jgi:hypothetical protein